VLSACMAASGEWEERGWLARQFEYCVCWVRVMVRRWGNIFFFSFSQFITRLDGNDIGCWVEMTYFKLHFGRVWEKRQPISLRLKVAIRWGLPSKVTLRTQWYTSGLSCNHVHLKNKVEGSIYFQHSRQEAMRGMWYGFKR
jgi:hypothetical protein